MAAISFVARTGLAGLLLAALIGCAASFTNHGYAPSDAELAEITVGVTTRDGVEEAIGRPSSTGVIGDDGWYYVSSRVRSYTYREPEIIDRQLVAISFNKRGVVENVERYGMEDGRVVVLQRRVTTSNIRPQTFIQQMLSNIGRVNLGG
jgi:outer membrane protein assembly factor BamE (lipoprotein component of BamABCDE complex)